MEKSSVHYHHSAIQHYLKGDLLKAKYDCELVAAHIPKHASTIGLLATIEKALGNFEQAEKLFKESLEIDSSQADILCNYAGLLILKEEFQSSVQLLNKAIIIAPKIADYYERLGYALWRMCKYEYALKSSLIAIELNPKLIAAHQNLGVILQAQGQLDQALEATLKVIELKPDHANAHINLGGILKQQGKLDQALEATLKAINIKPKQAVSHMNLGVILQEKGQLDQAMSATLKAIELNPDNSCAYINLAEILKRHEQLENANLAIERAMQIGIVGEESATSVLSYYETTNQLKSLAKAMEVIDSESVTTSIATQIFKARLLFRNKQYKNSLVAIAKISPLAAQNAGSITELHYWTFRAFIEDRNGYFDSAYKSFATAQKNSKYICSDKDAEYLRIELYKQLSVKLKQSENTYGERSCKWTFLIGFPRSGTTLLDTMLSSHPDIEVAEEKSPMNIVESSILTTKGKSIDHFNELTSNQISELREMYSSSMSKYCDVSKRIVVDKLPLNTICLPLIKLLFPSSKIIFAVRHPCDTVLSCFQQVFATNNAMANLGSIKTASEFYDAVMSGWMVCSKNLNVDHFISKYEDLVDDVEASMSAILDYLDIEWNQNVLRYQQTALERGCINTPSASQVVQPIYKTSIKKWLSYNEYFQDSMYVLDKWIDHWGY